MTSTPARLDRAQIEAIAARAEAATKGPWKPKFHTNYGGGHSVDYDMGRTVAHVYLTDRNEADATFIAAARADIPALILHAAALEAEIDALHGDCEVREQALSERIAELARLRELATNALYVLPADMSQPETSALRRYLEGVAP